MSMTKPRGTSMTRASHQDGVPGGCVTFHYDAQEAAKAADVLPEFVSHLVELGSCLR